MQYFCRNSDRKGSCYYEFRKGNECSGKHWLNSSIYLYDDLMYELGLIDVFTLIIPDFAPYGCTVVTRKEWEDIKTYPKKKETEKALNEISYWIEKNFEESNFFVIMGI